MIKTIQLDNRAAWLEHRRKYIGGSDAAAALGLSPWRTNVELWEEKTGRRVAPDISDNAAVKYGTEAEPFLRGLYALDNPQYKVDYIENNSIINDKYPFCAASVDGFLTEIETGRRGVLELKTSNIVQSMQKEKWRGRVPIQYFTQCLFYMEILEADFCELHAQLRFDYSGDIVFQRRTYHMERAEVQDDIEYLFKGIKKFYGYIVRDEKPPLILPEI